MKRMSSLANGREHARSSASPPESWGSPRPPRFCEAGAGRLGVPDSGSPTSRPDLRGCPVSGRPARLNTGLAESARPGQLLTSERPESENRTHPRREGAAPAPAAQAAPGVAQPARIPQRAGSGCNPRRRDDATDHAQSCSQRDATNAGAHGIASCEATANPSVRDLRVRRDAMSSYLLR